MSAPSNLYGPLFTPPQPRGVTAIHVNVVRHPFSASPVLAQEDSGGQKRDPNPMELMRELGKDGCNGSEGLFGTESSRDGCGDSRAEGLATAEVGMGSILERQSPATRKRLKRKNWEKREWVTVGPVSGNDGVVCFNHWRGEWSIAGSGLGLCAFDFSSTSLQLSGLRKVIHPL